MTNLAVDPSLIPFIGLGVNIYRTCKPLASPTNIAPLLFLAKEVLMKCRQTKRKRLAISQDSSQCVLHGQIPVGLRGRNEEAWETTSGK